MIKLFYLLNNIYFKKLIKYGIHFQISIINRIIITRVNNFWEPDENIYHKMSLKLYRLTGVVTPIVIEHFLVLDFVIVILPFLLT